MTIKTDKQLAESLWSARTMSDVTEIKKYLESKGTQWLPVGNRPNNAGIIDVATSPGAAIVERLTNCADALLELAYELAPDDSVTSPVIAAQHYYGVPKAGIAEMAEADRRALGSKIALNLYDSGNERRPTVVIDDRGIGQSPQGIPKTILSLGESNKLSKRYLMGTYNQGGSASLSFAGATIIVSRRHPKLLPDGSPDLVGITIVEQRDDETKKVASYEYVADSSGELLALDPSWFPDLPHGTRITLISYDLQISGPWTLNPYNFFQAALPSMPLPFLLGGKRTKPKDDAKSDRVMLGNAARLSRPDRARGDIEIPHAEDAYQDLGEHGKVRVRYWVVRRPLGSKAKGDPTAGYVEATSAICITLNGQRQDTEARQWINTKAKLPFLFKHLIVQIDADELTAKAKKELFSSVRERARQSDVRTLIYENLADLLRGDEDLKQLEREERERQLAKTTSTVNDKIRRKLGKYIKTAIKGAFKPGTKKGEGSGTGGSGGPSPTPPKPAGGTGQKREPRNTDDSALPEIPTTFRFEKASTSVEQGARSHVWIALDAKNGYLPDHDATLTIAVDGPGDKVTLPTRTRLLGGRARWVIEAAAAAELGDYKVTAEIALPSGTVLSDTMAVTVKEPKPQDKGTQPGGEPETGPDVRWITRDEWEDDWNEGIVGRVDESDEATIIFVNRHHRAIDQALLAPSLTEAQVLTRAERYQLPIAYALWAQHHELQKVADAGSSAQPTEDWLRAEMEHVAEAIIFAITPDEEGEDSDS